MNKQYLAVIQAGGKGTRLRELTKDAIPKPLLALNGKPMIQWQIENMKRYGIDSFVIITGHLGEKIEEYFGDGTCLGVHISYIRETEPLGSAGALYYVMEQYPQIRLGQMDILLIFGDVMFDIDVRRMISFHEQKESKATLLIHPNGHPYDSDLVVIDEDCRVTSFDSKNNTRDYWYKNLVNAGIYIISGNIISDLNSPVKTDMEKDILFKKVEQGIIYGYRTTEYVKDAGTVDRFKTVEREQASGLWTIKNYSNPQACIFLDRDGTINKLNDFIFTDDMLELEDNAAEAIRRINQSGMLAIVVTNQPQVARGMCDFSDIDNINNKLGVLLGQQGAYLDDIVYCPHHPDSGFEGERPELKFKCNCRKPATGMIDEMVKKYNIDLCRSWIVGDTTMDIQTGINAGIKTILVKTGSAGADNKYDVTPDYVVQDILEAVDTIFQ